MDERSLAPRPEIDVAVEEAYGLALDGRTDEALRVLDAVDAVHGRSGRSDLTRARCMLRGEQSLHATADSLIDRLAREPGAVQWQARLALARRAHLGGDTANAARLIKSGVDDLRRDGERSPADPLSALLRMEVEHLQSGGARARAATTAVVADDLLALVELGRRLGRLTEPADVLGAVLHEAIRLMRADRGFVVLTGPATAKGGALEYAAAENLDRSTIDDPWLEVSRSLIDQVRTTGEIEIIAFAELPDAHPARRSLGVLGVRAVACIPLIGTRETLGVMYLDASKDNSSFAPDRRPVLKLLATQAATAVDNVQAHREATLALERAEETIARHRGEAARQIDYHGIVGASAAMREVYARIERIVPTDEPVIIHGETGTGKELVARLIHARGPRREREFVAINCAGLAESILETELFGHERGAFTGADRARAGLLEVAHRGTLFLDEVADMPQRMQGDLLRTLQSGEVRRLGGRETFHVDVRVVAASNRDLANQVELGRFRADLYYRLAVLELKLPPLRDRAGDVELLVKALMPGLVTGGRAAPRFTERALARLAGHAWPGNVRELSNTLRRIAVLGLDVVDEHDLPPELRGGPVASQAGSLQQAEDQAIRRALREAGGNKTRAARLLGVDRKTLYVKLRRLGSR